MVSNCLQLCLFCATVLAALGPTSAASLERNAGKPKAYDWDGAISWAKDPLLTPLLNILKAYKVASAAIGYQVNPDPDAISYAPPKTWRTGQSWWMAGFGIDYRSPMRVASVSKPITYGVFSNKLSAHLDSRFYDLWTKNVGPLPNPKDARVKQITIRQLLDHTSGFDNAKIGFDPAFMGKSVTSQIDQILKTTTLLANPGTKFSYSNFGYMIAAQVAEGTTRKTFITLVRELFPKNAPVFAASDTKPVPAKLASGYAAEPGLYYVQAPDGEFDVSVMKGNGNIVSNVATLSWYATQYWLLGGKAGKKYTDAPAAPGSTWWWTMDGSMPGTMAVLSQYVNPRGRVSAICIIINMRIPGDSVFLGKLNDAATKLLVAKFEKLG